MNRNSLKWHLVEGPVTYDFTRHNFEGVLGHFYFGLSQFHGHGSWLVYEMAISSHCPYCQDEEGWTSTINHLVELGQELEIIMASTPTQPPMAFHDNGKEIRLHALGGI